MNDISPDDLVIEFQAWIHIRYRQAGILIERIETRRATVLLLRMLILIDAETRP